MTVKEIAELAGVSIGTVDRVLHGRGRVSDDTRERIESIVREHDYRPNPMARHLKLGKEYRFAVFMPEAGNDEGYWAQALAGIGQATEGIAPFGVKVDIVTYDRDREGSALAALERVLPRAARDDYDGVLAAPVEPDELGKALRALCARLPVVFFDAEVAGAVPLASIIQDPFRSGLLAGRLLDTLRPAAPCRADAPLPPRRFAIVNPHPKDEHLARRIEGVDSYFMDKAPGLAPELIRILPSGGAQEARMELSRRVADESIGLDGILVVNAQVAELTSFVSPANRPAIVGYDLVPANIDRLRGGRIDALISQDPAYQAAEGLRSLYRSVVLGEDVSAVPVRAPLDVYFAENLPE